ncbi:hypothetical protein, partial [Streptomyces prasinopilosus]|uniref:hypothetical protein n=1 Tax=Streptomyces prasinopilosus TaxID=67344 RepID=UPI0019CF5894
MFIPGTVYGMSDGRDGMVVLLVRSDAGTTTQAPLAPIPAFDRRLPLSCHRFGGRRAPAGR